MTDMKFELAPDEVRQANEIYAKLGDQTADDYKHLKMSMKRTAACVTLGVVRHMTPEQVSEWSDNDDFRAHADALIIAYEITHPEKLGVDHTAAEFITDLAQQLDHSQCGHGEGGDDEFGSFMDQHHEAFHDTSERMSIPDADVQSKFEDIMAGFGDTADEPPAPRPATFEVGTDGETTDTRDQQGGAK